MKTGIRELVAQHAATVIPRRDSLQLLAATLATGALAPRAAMAGKSDKGKSRCKAQRQQCLVIIEEFCTGQVKSVAGDPEAVAACMTRMGPCCNAFTKCHAGAGLTCLRQASAPVKEFQ
ncbi:MAG: hypothetical protein IT338_16870 [Thermomicrobiales bacterium]|nr:hypothetical protein [Thermomicrobiales bacterium]